MKTRQLILMISAPFALAASFNAIAGNPQLPTGVHPPGVITFAPAPPSQCAGGKPVTLCLSKGVKAAVCAEACDPAPKPVAGAPVAPPPPPLLAFKNNTGTTCTLIQDAHLLAGTCNAVVNSFVDLSKCPPNSSITNVSGHLVCSQ